MSEWVSVFVCDAIVSCRFVQIFPSALRAMRHREEHDLATPLHHGHPHQTTATEHEVEREPRQSQWLTEYGRAFKPYALSKYQPERVERAVRVKSPDLLPSTPRVHRDYLSMSPWCWIQHHRRYCLSILTSIDIWRHHDPCRSWGVLFVQGIAYARMPHILAVVGELLPERRCIYAEWTVFCCVSNQT